MSTPDPIVYVNDMTLVQAAGVAAPMYFDESLYQAILSSEDYGKLVLTHVDLLAAPAKLAEDRLFPSMIDYLKWVCLIHCDNLRKRFFPDTPHRGDGRYYLEVKNSHLLLLVDPEDYDRLKWRVIGIYGDRPYPSTDGDVHRKVMRWKMGYMPNGVIVDHIDHNPFNACKANLRIITPVESSRYQLMKRTNTTGYKGVTRHKDGRYVAQIRAGGRSKRIGYFDDPIDAAIAYYIYAQRFHGQFAIVRRPDAPQERFDAMEARLKSNKHNPRASSRFYGVSRQGGHSKPWRAMFTHKKIVYTLGYFDNEEDAARVVDVKLTELGNLKRLNFGRKDEDVFGMGKAIIT